MRPKPTLISASSSMMRAFKDWKSRWASATMVSESCFPFNASLHMFFRIASSLTREEFRAFVWTNAVWSCSFSFSASSLVEGERERERNKWRCAEQQLCMIYETKQLSFNCVKPDEVSEDKKKLYRTWRINWTSAQVVWKEMHIEIRFEDCNTLILVPYHYKLYLYSDFVKAPVLNVFLWPILMAKKEDNWSWNSRAHKDVYQFQLVVCAQMIKIKFRNRDSTTLSQLS